MKKTVSEDESSNRVTLSRRSYLGTVVGLVSVRSAGVAAESSEIGGYGQGGYGAWGYGGSTTDNNTAPTASNDSVSVRQGEAVTIDVLTDDSDSDGSLDSSSVTIQTRPSNGSSTVNTDGTIEYSHDGSDTTSDSLTYTVDDDTGATSNEATVSVSVETVDQAPYTTHDLSRIQAEDFDTGGEGVAYHDTTSGNSGGAYRDTDVDIEGTSDDGGGHNIGWIEKGKWWEYTVDISADGEYI